MLNSSRNALPDDIKLIYEKACTWCGRITKDDIVKFQNDYITHSISGVMQEHNFIEFCLDKNFFRIYKDGTTFHMLCYKDPNFKLKNFEKCLIKVTKLD